MVHVAALISVPWKQGPSARSPTDVMPRISYRWLLPFGHAVVDLLLLAAWIGYGTMLIRQVNIRSGGHAPLFQPALFQDGDTVRWDPPTLPPPPRFALLMTGTLPAAAVSMSVRPEAWYITRGKLWDPVWLLIHEAVAIPFWFLIGLTIDSGGSRLRKPMLWYLVGRSGLGLLVVGPWTAPNFGVLLQFLFWVCFSIYGFVCVIQWVGRKADTLRKRTVKQ